MHRPLIVFISLAVFTPTVSQASTITFEIIPGIDTPVEGLEISDQFLATEGISFSLEGGGFPVLAEVGTPITAFDSDFGGDSPQPDQDIGSFFLTDNGTLSGLSSPALIVEYSSPTAAASGVILDVDFDESFNIQALDESGNRLATITIEGGDTGTGDGLATSWSFDQGSNEVFAIRFEGTRETSGAFGLGFDNFDARSSGVATSEPIGIPEPSTVGAILLAGLTSVRYGR